jgi:hypothetical protein
MVGGKEVKLTGGMRCVFVWLASKDAVGSTDGYDVRPSSALVFLLCIFDNERKTKMIHNLCRDILDFCAFR